jgi:hypothetical protein
MAGTIFNVPMMAIFRRVKTEEEDVSIVYKEKKKTLSI